MSKSINRAVVEQSRSSGLVEKNGHLIYRLVISDTNGEPAKVTEVKFTGDPNSEEDLDYARTIALGKQINHSNLSGERDWSNLVLTDLNFTEATKAYRSYSGKKNGSRENSVTNLSNFDFSGCLVTRRSKGSPGTTFAETILDSSNFDNLIADVFDIRGAKNKKGKPVSMCGINVTEELLGAGSDLFYPMLRGAKIKSIDLINTVDSRGKEQKKKAKWYAALFSQAEISGGTIEQAELVNGDWGSSVLVGVNASGADLRDNLRDEINASLARGMKSASDLAIKSNDLHIERILKSREFPNKVRNSVFVNLTIDKNTKLNGMNRRSLWLSNAVRKVSKVGFTTAALLLMTAVDITGFSWVDAATSSLGKGNILLVTAALDFAKSKVFEDMIGAKIRDKATKYIVSGQKNIIGKARSLKERMRNLRVVLGGKEAMQPLMRSMHAVAKDGKKPGALKSLYRAIKGDGDVVLICEKGMLGKAVANISANRNRSYSVKKDVTLARVGAEKFSVVPSTITFHKNGNKSLTYLDGDDVVLVSSDTHGKNPTSINLTTGKSHILPDLSARGITKDDDGVLCIKGAINLFERSILDENGLKDFSYDPDLSYVAVGESGRTMFVHNKSTRDLHSRTGPALVHLDKSAIESDDCWTKEYFLKGEHKTRQQFKEENARHEGVDLFANKILNSGVLEGLRAAKNSMLTHRNPTKAQKTAMENIERSLGRIDDFQHRNGM